ncbi:hypothetical protein [Paraburkholderia caballeronis]|uniref:Uncharacterized protein n=1 Tax=Paraburkholderia caballeronis TaxID=416943 RepID=A0A1H7L098_9BURK|nr:hypothetical protein [Paraburkholderia caballeronis]PXW28241.1 hypothetical protein C7403_102133 [Paraburkholderia caballeronis]PXX03607.1 hypothetical protein C7407_102133 [Paraburkholderia caballeronis]RAK04351.1 hypothetical protein C7409_102133 [Paraburkholderia caballeronis]SED83742.1 hypothetical protein SAMN05445871_4046 [Paraburkholderia caballeronis]SEK92469.1 hypothetical protein SAMN05192542_104133 [Paraburkholderia caballeronis]
MTMVLTVLVPSPVVVELRSGHRTRLSYRVDDVEFVTGVRALRRIRRADGSFDADRVEVEAFIPEHQRRGVEAPKKDWITPEYLRCYAFLVDNCKSLRDFFESGELEREV